MKGTIRDLFKRIPVILCWFISSRNSEHSTKPYPFFISSQDGKRIDLPAVRASIQGTKVLRSLKNLRQGSCHTSFQRHPPGALLDVACARIAARCPTVVINAASAYHAGGGFLTGGRHALEESICMRSTLFNSLKAAESIAESLRLKSSLHCQPPMKSPGGSPKVFSLKRSKTRSIEKGSFTR